MDDNDDPNCDKCVPTHHWDAEHTCPKCDDCGGRHFPSAPHETGKCSLCGNQHSFTVVNYATYGQIMDGNASDYYRQELSMSDCPVFLKQQQEAKKAYLLKIERQKMWSIVIREITAANVLHAFFPSRYEDLRMQANRNDRQTRALYGQYQLYIPLHKLAEHILLKAQTLGLGSRLYRSTPQSVKTAIQNYLEWCKKSQNS